MIAHTNSVLAGQQIPRKTWIALGWAHQRDQRLGRFQRLRQTAAQNTHGIAVEHPVRRPCERPALTVEELTVE
jgi:hypothetical protein